MELIRKAVVAQINLCRRFDTLIPEHLRVDGNQEFGTSFIPKYLKPDITIYDLGGGKNPFLSSQDKHRLGSRVVGIDIDAAELSAAPEGVYDRTIVADIATYRGQGDADLVICRALLEHVRDVPAAFRAIATILKPEGVALIFVPCRNALFARLNLLLPERTKRAVLFGLFPKASREQGFPSYYHRCTPRDFRQLATDQGLRVMEQRLYYQSAYFTFFLPLHVLWRAWVLLFRAIAGAQAAETFSMAIEKRR